jgi:hypothetical protein
MGRSLIPSALVELSNPTTPEAQVSALRNLKNEIVGHDQRKELAIKHGVVKPLVGILRAEARKGGKRRRGVANGGGSENGNSSAPRESERATEWNTEDELRFQATLVVGSLANGKLSLPTMDPMQKHCMVGGDADCECLQAALPSSRHCSRAISSPRC